MMFVCQTDSNGELGGMSGLFEAEVITFYNGRIKENHFQHAVVNVIVVSIIYCISLHSIDICLCKRKAAGQSATSE